MNSLKINSYAKINLTLSIKNKRLDGYHEIESIMQTISLHDKIKLKKDKKIICKTNVKNIPTDEKNLAFKAAKLFFEHTKIKGGVKILIKKKIPQKSGLAGGSSNAAFTLLGLNLLYKTNLEEKTLINLSKKIGADVAFFIKGGTAYVKGFGEKIEKIKPIKDFFIVLVKPNFEVETKNAYAKYDEFCEKNKQQKITNIKNLILSIDEENKIEKITKYFQNDFEKILNHNEIKEIKNNMKNLKALSCNITGSGSCLFAIFKNLKTAKKATNFFKKKKLETFLSYPIEKYS